MNTTRTYGVYLSFDADTSQETKDSTLQLLNKHISILNEKYNDSCKIIKNVDNYDYFTATKNLSLLNDLISQVTLYLKENVINYIIAVSLYDKLNFLQKSKDSPIQDTLDFLRNYITINSELAKSEYIIDTINYYQSSSDNIIYMINLKSDSMSQLSVKVSCILDKSDSLELSHIISILDCAYNDIRKKMEKLTEEKKEESTL